MTKHQLIARTIWVFGGLATIISCDSGGAPSELPSTDCPYGTFRPAGLADCVFPATDINNQPIGVSDNRCAFGQPAIPPQCVSDGGGRAYLSTSTTCAPGYRLLPGACIRNTGSAGSAGPPMGGTGGPCPPGSFRAPEGFCVSTGAGGDSAGTGGVAGSGGAGGSP